MKITFAAISARSLRTKSEAADRLHSDYLERASHYILSESRVFDSETGLFGWVDRQAGRTPAYLVLLDSRGRDLSSEEFAERIGRARDDGVQRLVFAIGPADGWSAAARQRAHLLLSLGRMTLPHQLAGVVLVEQVYRALTILAGHPYHSGH
ncbi:MAG TPA: 23S rRNA (pseudouridine(1915)-N(3))-methyltransferase RlmH [Edaphobacter sp.]|jgi:23S rRNA (pseudouridine1915-N3)-methyltransferase|nr:23S rRNA (pseudouridine(1915)-N(3))-methyltransferase RlmH [Edaphobacter sp.]